MNFIIKCLFLIFATSILHAEPNAKPFIAVGSSGIPVLTMPLVLVSENNGDQWSYIPFPEEETGGRLISVACHNNQCTALGNGIYPFPLIYSSSDAMHSWQANKNISELPDDLNYIDMSGMSCVGNVCIAVGRYGASFKRDGLAPILLRSEDSGKSWKFIKDIPSLYPQGYLFQNLTISCSGENCAIAGTAAKNDMYHPFILASHDSGRTWVFIEKIADLTVDCTHNYLANIHCEGTNCIAAGAEMNLNAYESKPLFIYSNDAGRTWIHSKDITGLSQKNDKTLVTTLHCNGTFCIAGGSNHLSESQPQTPSLFISRDSGKSWAYVSTPLTERVHGAINSIQCEGPSCIVLGGYPAFILTTQDQGQSWKIIENIPGQTYLMSNSSLNTLSCKENNCAIAGTLWNMGMYRPFFLLSHDHGITWQVNQNIIGLPITEYNFFLSNLMGAKSELPYPLFGIFKTQIQQDWTKKLTLFLSPHKIPVHRQ
ncbi:MAG: WD40/YVTN/BNR-like repeat-containing protein [Gammaproteobacteria bacterium]